MWTHGLAVLGRHQHDREIFVQPSQSARIDLHDVNRVGGEELLEHDTVLAMLTGRDTDGMHGLGDAAMAQNIVGARRL